MTRTKVKRRIGESEGRIDRLRTHNQHEDEREKTYSVVSNKLAILEQLDGGESTNAVGGGEISLNSAVNLGNTEESFLLLSGGELIPSGGESLAVSAPGSVAKKVIIVVRKIHS